MGSPPRGGGRRGIGGGGPDRPPERRARPHAGRLPAGNDAPRPHLGVPRGGRRDRPAIDHGVPARFRDPDRRRAVPGTFRWLWAGPLALGRGADGVGSETGGGPPRSPEAVERVGTARPPLLPPGA